jgi:hypothetical protein
MAIQILGDFASALAHLSDAEFFAALGGAVSGVAGLMLNGWLQSAKRAAERHLNPLDHDQAA